MPKKNQQPPIVLPARMILIEDAIANLEIAVFDFPYQDAIDEFLNGLKRVLRKEQLEPWQYPPYRLLNSAIIACAPTVVHGFEKYGQYSSTVRRIMAVGKSIYNPTGFITGSTLQYPSEEQIAQLIRVWIQVWGQQPWLRKQIEGEARELWRNLEQSLDAQPQTQWRRIEPEVLVADLNAETGLAFNAIPSLLATLLHGEQSIIGQQEKEVKWRKAQDSSNRLCVVSEPLPISFMRKKGFTEELRDGFFAYKLEFQIQTQTGRTKPWIHVFLHCQRYAHLPPTRNTRGNDITLLVGMNQARIDGWNIDSTLVCLKAKKYLSERSSDWLESLPVLLTNIGARSLAAPFNIYQNPQAFWKAEETDSNDEYYIVHAEGYRYSRYRSEHSVMTGFGLAERSEIIEQTCCSILGNVLQPDTHLEPDVPMFVEGIPHALWNFSDLVKSPKLLTEVQAKKRGLTEEQRFEYRDQENRQQRQERQFILVEAVHRALRSKRLLIFIIYRNEDTREALYQQLREAFLLNEADPFPPNIVISDQLIFDPGLWEPLSTGDLSPTIRNDHPSRRPDGFDSRWNTQIRRAHNQKMQAWRNFLQRAQSNFLQDGLTANDICCAALIELPEEPESGDTFHKSQSMKGAIREACAREKILSQMIHPVNWITNKTTAERVLPGSEKGRSQNAVQEIVSRQIGVLYGTLPEVYQKIGISEPIAQQLDVVAFCLETTQVGVRYGCAVRLRANGEVDVLLPERNQQWRSYTEVGTYVGTLFAEARKDVKNGKISDKQESAIRLSLPDLVRFVEDTLTLRLERPTVVLIKAENWRNKGGWTQLQNPLLSQMLDRLEFAEERRGQPRVYQRDDNRLNHLLAVIRIRSGNETPQYVTNRETWQKDDSHLSRDLVKSSGFIDRTAEGIFHYFSIGRLPDTVKGSQTKKQSEDPYKSEDGGGISFKHQQMVEMVPFFVHSDFQTEEGLKALCRVPHYLRFSPAWSMGNILLSYPMYLGEQLIKDQLCILGVEE